MNYDELKKYGIIMIIIIILVLFFIFYIYKKRENICMCNGPQVNSSCKSRLKSQESYNKGNTELATQKPRGELIMSYDVFPGKSNPSDSCECCAFIPL